LDVDLNDVITLGVETKLVLNYPKPVVAVLPVALAVSLVSMLQDAAKSWR
jgi:maintenance of morphology protein 1